MVRAASSWPAPAVHQHQVRARRGLALFLLLHQAAEAALEHLAHHAEVVAGGDLGPLDVELAVARFHEAPPAPPRSCRPQRSCPRCGSCRRPRCRSGGPSSLNASATPASRRAWAEPSAMRRPSASRALVRAWATSSRFSPRWGTASSIRWPVLTQKASASRAELGGAWESRDQARYGAVLVELAEEGFEDRAAFVLFAERRVDFVRHHRVHTAGSTRGCPSSGGRGRRRPGRTPGRPPRAGRRRRPRPRSAG